MDPQITFQELSQRPLNVYVITKERAAHVVICGSYEPVRITTLILTLAYPVAIVVIDCTRLAHNQA